MIHGATLALHLLTSLLNFAIYMESLPRVEEGRMQGLGEQEHFLPTTHRKQGEV